MPISSEKAVIDVCCGSKMFWYDRNHPATVFMDNRVLDTTLCDGRTLSIAPDVVGDFRDIPFPDNTFKLAVFDPPHLVKLGDRSWMAQKYGVLPMDWQPYIKQGFDECLRVLQPYGILVFKWNEDQIKAKALLEVLNTTPLFGDRRAKTHWLIFMKEESDAWSRTRFT